MFRVDSLSTDSASPLGKICIGGSDHRLAEFDLVILLGPNGAGKTRVSESLLVRNEGHLEALSLVGGEGSLCPRSDVAQSLVSRNSVELLTEFTSMNDSLSKAIGLGAIVGERMVLEATQKKLKDLIPPASTGCPLDLRAKLADHARAEDEAVRSVGEEPLSLCAYNRIGREVGRLGRKPWVDCRTVDSAEMEQRERDVRPQLHVLEGRHEFLEACSRVHDLPERGMTESAANRLHDEIRLVDDFAQAARAILGADADNVDVSALASLCAAASARHRSEAKDREGAASRLSALATLRDEVRELLSRDHDCTACYVCRQGIDRQRLLDELARQDSAGESALQLRKEAAELKAKAKEAEDAADRLQQAFQSEAKTRHFLHQRLEEFVRTFEGAVDALSAIRRAAPVVQTAIESALKDVAGVLARLRAALISGSCDDATDACRRGVATLKSLKDADSSLSRHESQLNADVDKGLRHFDMLPPLRRVLAIAREVNEIRWEPDWKQAREVARIKDAITPWEAAIRELIEERGAQERTARDRILQDPEVRDRFDRLVRQLHSHPLMRDLELNEDNVSADGEPLFGKSPGKRNSISRLSEGYQVLVNLAAFIAVAGHVREGQQHKVGWILLDEPTNGLDPDHRAMVADYLGSLDRTIMPRQIFVTTFEPEFAARLARAARRDNARRCITFTFESFNGTPISQPRVTVHA
jgi:hypothetical protein